MPFNSFEYFAFLTCVVALYWALPRRGRPMLLLVSSYLFYAAADWRFVPLLAISTAVSYLCAHAMPTREPSPRRVLLFVSVGSSLVVLVAFKTLNVVTGGSGAGGLSLVVGQSIGKVLVPVGLSYYTFQTISYVIDVYRGDAEPEPDPVAFGAYVAFFPHLLAGPIVRANRLIPQIKQSSIRPRGREVGEGLQLLLIGLFKKVAVSEPLFKVSVEAVRPAFGGAADAGGPVLVTATVVGIIASFFDIAGYIDMARGSAKLLGIEMQRNFAQPLTRSLSLTDFWRRWQVTVMGWFRDYVYRPVRGPQRREGLAIAATFLAAGAWHGLTLGWVVWGMLTATILIVERRFGVPRRNERRVRQASSRAQRAFQRGRSLVVVWVLLVLTAPWAGSNRIGDAASFFGSLLHVGSALPDASLLAFLGYGLAILVVSDRFERRGELAPPGGRLPAARWLAFGAMVAAIVVFGGATAQDFLYFQF